MKEGPTLRQKSRGQVDRAHSVGGSGGPRTLWWGGSNGLCTLWWEVRWAVHTVGLGQVGRAHSVGGVRWVVHTLVGDQVGRSHSVGLGQVSRAHSGGGVCVKWAMHTLVEWHQLCRNSELLQVYYGQHRRRG